MASWIYPPSLPLEEAVGDRSIPSITTGRIPRRVGLEKYVRGYAFVLLFRRFGSTEESYWFRKSKKKKKSKKDKTELVQ